MLTYLCRVTMFGNYFDFDATQDNIEKVLNCLSETKYSFLPTIIEEKTRDKDQKIINKKKLQFIFEDYLIRILSNRIDIEKNYNDLIESQKINDSTYELLVILKRIISIKELNTLSNRLAFYVQNIEENTEVKVNNFINRNFMCFNDSNEKINDWDLGLSYRKEINNEESNICITIAKGLIQKDNENNIETKSGILFTVDINTVQENMELKYSCDDMEKYVQEARKVFIELSNKLIDRI